MEAEERLGIEVVDSGPRAIPRIRQLRVGLVSRDAVLLPLFNVAFRNFAVMLSLVITPDNVCDLAHGSDANDAFQCEVCLVRQPAGEVVGAELVMRYK